MLAVSCRAGLWKPGWTNARLKRKTDTRESIDTQKVWGWVGCAGSGRGHQKARQHIRYRTRCWPVSVGGLWREERRKLWLIVSHTLVLAKGPSSRVTSTDQRKVFHLPEPHPGKALPLPGAEALKS